MSRHDQDQVEVLLTELRRAAKSEAAEARVVLSGDRLRALAEDLSRLLQSSAFLRRQNAKLRRRIERLKAGGSDEGEEAEGEGEAPDIGRDTE